MAVARLQLHARRPIAGGTAFGDVGPYERLDGTVHFAVDPAHEANAGIVDLDKVARRANGRVHFQADFCLLQPVDPGRANGRLLLEVPNRGRKGVLGRLNRPAPPGSEPALDGIEVGDGLLLRLGWTVAWCGWQWDVIRTLVPAGLIGLQAPQALDGSGRPICGQVMLQWQPNEAAPDHLLADRIHQPYPAARLDGEDTVFSYQEYPEGPRTEVPRSRWWFAHDEAGLPVPDNTHVWLEGGFQPGRIYTLVYTTRTCPVVGVGLLAIRDCVSFLRYGTAGEGNPCVGRIEYTLGYGSSQCGRFLRHFLHLGLNEDERGRRAIDGVLINVAGARRGEFNHRYAQPSVITARSFGHLPPFAFDDQTDPLTGDLDGLLRRQRQRGNVPRIVTTNTSSEYWGRDASLLHTNVVGELDMEPPEDVRVYHFAGTKHGPGSLRPEADTPEEEALPGGGQRVNVVDFQPLLRAAFFNLVAWVVENRMPPPSMFPRLADGTAARAGDVLEVYHAIPGVTVVDWDRLLARRRLDLGPDAGRGIGRYPPREGDVYAAYVPAVDEDGNEVGGIRLPDVAVPVATHTGWFPRRPGTGGPGQNTDMLGSTIPFAATPEARRQAGDPRLSIAERYRDRADYAARARAVAEQLAATRYLLAEDVEAAVQNAVAQYDAFV